jgi:hypothetical protein
MTASRLTGPPDGLAYRLISGADDPDFCRRVSDWVAAGYVPHGNPTMTIWDGKVTVGQALVWPRPTDS